MENNEMPSGGGVGVGRNVWGRESGEISGGFSDLDVYKNSFKGMITVFKQILPLLPKEEKYDLTDQLRRSSKAIPRLIAEGHSKRHQNKGFQKYIDDAHAESNETIVSLIQARELYLSNDKRETCNNLIDLYDKISRQLYNLASSWEKFHRRKPHDS
ncbi:MAG: four helix bundle protein [Candidatus Margulisiibacteriota bacterium]